MNFDTLNRDYQMVQRDCEKIQRESEQTIVKKQSMIDSIAGELDSYADKLRKSESESKSLRTTVEQLQNVVDRFEARESNLEKSLTSLGVESSQDKGQIQQLQGALEKERETHAQLKHSFDSQQQTIAGFTSTISNKNNYISRLEENVRHYQSEHERLVAQLEETKLLQRGKTNEIKQANEKETKLKNIIDDHKRFMEQQSMQISTLRSESKSMSQARDQLISERDDALFKINNLEERILKLQVSLILTL